MQLFTATPSRRTVQAPQLPGVAADVRAGQVEVVADEVDEELPRLDLALVALAVDRDVDRRG